MRLNFITRAVLGSAILATPVAAQRDDPALLERARGIHQRVMALDTHVDISPANFTAERNYTQRLTTQVNLPKMEEGGLDAAFLIVYVGRATTSPGGIREGPRRRPREVRGHSRLASRSPGPDRPRVSAADARRIYASGKKVALIGTKTGIRSAPTSPT